MPHQRITQGQEFILGKIYALESQTVRSLFDEYRAAFRRMRESLNAAFGPPFTSGNKWSATDNAFRQRTEFLMAQLVGEMDVLTRLSSDLALDATENAFRAGAVGTAWVAEMAGLSDVAIPLLPTEMIRAQILAPYEGGTFVDRFEDNRLQFEQRIRRALVQSQIEGEGILEAQRRIAAELGITISDHTSPGQRTHRQNFNRTQVIARTEIIRASALGSLATYRENRDILRGYEWLTAMDDRVCIICAPLDGRIFDMNGNPIDGKGTASVALPPAHPQCRCSAAPALLDEDLERRVVGKRQTFLEWAAEKGLDRNVYGQAFDLRGQKAPLLRRAS